MEKNEEGKESARAEEEEVREENVSDDEAEGEVYDEADDEFYDEADEDDGFYDGGSDDEAQIDTAAGTEAVEQKYARLRKKRRRRNRLILILCIVAAAIVAAYIGVGIYFRGHFLPNTVISGIECDYMTADELADAIQEEIDQYQLQIIEREGAVETLSGVDFGLHLVYGDTLTEIMQDQGPFRWLRAYFGNSSAHDVGKAVEWDQEQFVTEVDALNCMDEHQMIEPEDAEILFSEEEGAYYIKPEEYGTQVDAAAVIEALSAAVASLDDSVDLDEMGCYEEPDVTESSPEMIALCDRMNQMIAAEITYDMIDIENITISKAQLSEWVLFDPDTQELTYDEEAIRDFVTEFAETYDTRDKPHYLHTSWGGTASASNSGYGWTLNQQAEYEQLLEEIEAGETVEREPIWSHTAKSHGENDYGNTYVEINLTRQHLYFYKNGSLIVDSNFVSGKMTVSRVTHAGIYYVYSKQKNATLRGEDYETPVSFWMPFNGGEGMHDATWRSNFGGTIYINNGSHGCINLPYSVAKTIYENIEVGDCVFVYWENGQTVALSPDPPKSTTDDTDTGEEDGDDTDDNTTDDTGETPNTGDAGTSGNSGSSNGGSGDSGNDSDGSGSGGDGSGGGSGTDNTGGTGGNPEDNPGDGD